MIIERVVHRDHGPYLTRIALTPMTRWGQGLLQIFHRGDMDQDPHDHPFEFITLPLTSYVEKVLDQDHMYLRLVRRWRLHRRPRTFKHIVMGWGNRYRYDRHRRVVTLVWRSPKVQDWGFWVRRADPLLDCRPVWLGSENLLFSGTVREHVRGEYFGRLLVPWRLYLGTRESLLR